jgi:hypothetical protein
MRRRTISKPKLQFQLELLNFNIFAASVTAAFFKHLELLRRKPRTTTT